MSRPLTAVTIMLLMLALPLGVAHGTDDSPVDQGVAERPPDLPSWLIASRLGRPLDDGEDGMGGDGLRDLDAVLLRQAPAPIQPAPLTLRTSGEDTSDLRAFLGRAERWHLMTFGANAGSRPQEVRISAYGAVAYVPSLSLTRSDGGLGFGPVTAPGAAFGVGLDDQEEPVSLGFKGQLGTLGLEGARTIARSASSWSGWCPGPPPRRTGRGPRRGSPSAWGCCASRSRSRSSPTTWIVTRRCPAPPGPRPR